MPIYGGYPQWGYGPDGGHSFPLDIQGWHMKGSVPRLQQSGGGWCAHPVRAWLHCQFPPPASKCQPFQMTKKYAGLWKRLGTNVAEEGSLWSNTTAQARSKGRQGQRLSFSAAEKGKVTTGNCQKEQGPGL